MPGPVDSKSYDFGLRIFNPGGSEAEKNLNGLRIFAPLNGEGLVGQKPFSVETLGGIVSCKADNGGGIVTVHMGEVNFNSQTIPVAGSPREVLNEDICISGKAFKFCAATIPIALLCGVMEGPRLSGQQIEIIIILATDGEAPSSPSSYQRQP